MQVKLRSKKMLLMTAMLGSVAAVQAEMKLDEVLAEYIEAKGGMEFINKTNTMKVTGVMTMGPMEAPLNFTIKRPNKVYSTFEIQGMKGIQAYDGEKGWQVMPFMGKTEPEYISGDELKQLQDQGDIEGPLINAEAKGNVLELIGSTEIEGTPVIEIKATKKNGDVMTVFLDEEYKLEVMTRSKMSMMGQEIEAETYFSDYKEVGDTGVPVAHSMAVKMNGTAAQTITFEKIEYNIDVDDALFKMPAATEKKEAAEATE